jgi:hypothetical protein
VIWRSVNLVILLSMPVVALQEGKPPENTASPFRVFMYEAKKSEDGEFPLAEVTQIVRKAFAARDEWFSVVDDPLDAEVLLEVVNEWKEGDEPVVVNRDTLSPIASPDVKGAVVLPSTVGKGEYSIEIHYSIPRQFEPDCGDRQKPGNGGAASAPEPENHL